MTTRSLPPTVVIAATVVVLSLAGCEDGEAEAPSGAGMQGSADGPALAGTAGMAAQPSLPSGAGTGDLGSAGTSGASAGRGPMSNAGAQGAAGSSAGATGGGGGPGELPVPDGSVTVIVAMHLNRPTDLEWNPYVTDELWVMNYGDSSAAIVTNATGENRSVQHRADPEGSLHFMPEPTAFAFGGRETSFVDAQGEQVEGTFATCPESTTSYMGPTLWTSDLRIFAISKRNREPPFNGPDTGGEGPGSHLDMLHRTPTCTGIAWGGAGNVYWTYSGMHSMFVKYDFASDHGIGNRDHSDGSVWRYPVSGIGYVPTVPSHLELDPERSLIYMADTGNGRVVTFDPASATQSTMMSALENVDGLQEALDLEGGEIHELVAGSYGLKQPSGLELHEDALYVSDSETSSIHKFSLDGAPLGNVTIADVEQHALAGLAVGPDGKLYFVDMIGDRVLRLDSAF